MEEIAQQFCEELQELIDRYKTKLSVPRIMHVAQDVLHKTLSIKHNPELHSEEVNGLKIPAELLEEPEPDHELKKILQGEFLSGEAIAEKSWQSKCLWYKINTDESAYKTGFKDGYNIANGDIK